MHQNESNKIPHEYILSSIYTLKIKFKFLFLKVEKHKVDKQKGIDGVLFISKQILFWIFFLFGKIKVKETNIS